MSTSMANQGGIGRTGNDRPAERAAFSAWCDASDEDGRDSMPAQTWAFVSWTAARRLLLAERQPQQREQLALFAGVAA
jgi:hypothetical protein